LLDWYGLRFAVESVLRWLGTAVVLLAVAALALREPWALVVAAPALVWTSCFVPQMMPLDPASGDRGLMVASQNVEAGNADLDRTVGTVLSRSPDVFALEEYTGGLSSAMADRVDAGWPHHVHIGTVAIFSRYEIVDDEALGLGHGWTRAFSAVIPAPHGDVTVYVVHADSARATDHSGRDACSAPWRTWLRTLMRPGSWLSATSTRGRTTLPSRDCAASCTSRPRAEENNAT
jgi:vancomycin resistance protein VanJ